MIHLLWIIPAYLLVGFALACLFVRLSILEAQYAAAWFIAWPLFIPFCIVIGLHEGCRRVLVKMEERNHDDL